MKRIIIANWKTNPQSLSEAVRLFDEIKKAAVSLKKSTVVIAPPFVYLESLSKKLGKKIKLGAQNLFWEERGAFTGEISPVMLKSFKTLYAIIGHSERRAHLAETDEMINKKIKAALSDGIKTILCVGEKEREPDILPKIVKDELTNGLKGIPKKFAENIIIAYEPIWAISSNVGSKADSPENLFKMVIYIRRILLDIFGKRIAQKTPILYGGSVDDKNVLDFLAVEGVSGLLVGGASLDSKKFIGILRKTESL